MINTLYTIGYAGFSIEDFVKSLKSHKIDLVVDVRSKPYSQYYADFNKEPIENKLEEASIYYRSYAKEFGARQDDKQYYPEGYLDFGLFTERSLEFASGVERLINSMEKGYTFALMCAEKDPSMCHRTIMVARAFCEKKYHVIHLLSNNKETTQKDIEKQLLEKFFPQREQLNLFQENISNEEYVKRAYALQNAEIGYACREDE